MDIIFWVGTVYLSVGAVVSAWNYFRAEQADHFDFPTLLARVQYPNGLPLSLRVAKFIGTGLALAVGIIAWPVAIRHVFRHRTDAHDG